MTSQTPLKGQSAADLYPELLPEWIEAENDGQSLFSFKRGSGFSGNWTCQVCKHKWPATIVNRTKNGSGCPKCGSKRAHALMRGKIKQVPFEKSIAGRFPELIPFWDEEKNEYKVTEVGLGSESKYYWKCSRGHESLTVPWVKFKGMKDLKEFPCKDCYLEDKNKPKPGKSLAEVNPAVAALWHPKLNGNLTPWDVYAHAQTYAWWLCEHGHPSFALINSKVEGYGCKHCNPYNMSKSEERARQALITSGLFASLSDRQVTIPLRWRTRYVAEVDMLGELPDGRKIVVEYDGAFHHAQKKTMPRDLAKTAALLDAGYVVLRIRERDLFHVDINHPNLLQVNFHFNRLRPNEAMPGLVENVRQLLAQ